MSVFWLQADFISLGFEQFSWKELVKRTMDSYMVSLIANSYNYVYINVY